MNTNLDPPELDESGFSNIKGYFFLITKVLQTRIDAFIQKDIDKELDCLKTLHWLLIGYFTEKERLETQIKFTQIHQLYEEYKKYENLKINKKYQQAAMMLRYEMNELADQLSLKMHTSNLYTIIREKGSYLYN